MAIELDPRYRFVDRWREQLGYFRRRDVELRQEQDRLSAETQALYSQITANSGEMANAQRQIDELMRDIADDGARETAQQPAADGGE